MTKITGFEVPRIISGSGSCRGEGWCGGVFEVVSKSEDGVAHRVSIKCPVGQSVLGLGEMLVGRGACVEERFKDVDQAKIMVAVAMRGEGSDLV